MQEAIGESEAGRARIDRATQRMTSAAGGGAPPTAGGDSVDPPKRPTTDEDLTKDIDSRISWQGKHGAASVSFSSRYPVVPVGSETLASGSVSSLLSCKM